MKRLLPDSLAGWTIVVLLAGLSVAQLLTIAIYLRERSGTVTVLEHVRTAERIADIAQLIDSVPPDQRPQLLARLASATLQVAWTRTPAVTDTDPEDWRREAFTAIIQAALVGVTLKDLRVAFDPREPASLAGAQDPRPQLRDRSTAVGRAIDEALTAHARGPVLRVALQLDDGSWLNFQAPFVGVPPALSPRALVLIGVAELLILALVIWALRRLTAPLTTLADAADNLGRNVYTSPLEVRGSRELRSAATAFNTMQERIRRFVADRTQMIAAISHDLRTPITRLRLRAEFVDDEESRRKLLADLAEMETMINSTLSFAREEATAEPSMKVDLVSLVQSTCDEMPEASFSLEPAVGDRLTYTCRPVALRRCLANVIDNAIKYGYQARVTLARDVDGIRIVVDDDGPGVPPEDRERVFEPFTRLDSSRSADTGGTGLGLTIARTIARTHGGDVTLSNRPEGGLRVTIHLP